MQPLLSLPSVSGLNGSDRHVGGPGAQAREILEIDRGNDRTSCEVGYCDKKGVDGKFRAGADCAEQLASPDADDGIDWPHLHPLAPQASEDCRIGRSAPHHLGQDRGHSCDRQLASTHLDHKGADPVPPFRRALAERRQRFAVEKQHQPALRRVRFESHSSTSRAAHSSVSDGTGP